MAHVAVVQGSSKGIGLAITRHLLKNTELQVVATSRVPKEARASILQGLGQSRGLAERLHNMEMDVQHEDSIEHAASWVKDTFGKNLRLLVNVSGVLLPEKSIFKIQKGEMQKTFEINTFGHLLTYKHFVPLLRPASDKNQKNSTDLAKGLINPDVNVLASLSARVGSIADNSLGGWYSYRASKTALNQIMVTLQKELNARGSIAPTVTVALHPGTVAGTELSKDFVPKEKSGSKEGVHDAETAAKKLLEVISNLGVGDGGQFLDYKGSKIMW
ncbi:hypothetical protein O181_000569 [Austropuccinia psidii MF-1]|uniref:Rossman fold oxidoreductase n=1 Tax=Austropuccinia psidii MF-1 TaxID=1389203 RepID=A0A9Q3GB18_9BASI|nr:hypothetical protein [Austropuccinia psidii MF-1]